MALMLKHKGILFVSAIVILFLFAEIILRLTLYRIPSSIEEIPAISKRENSPPWVYRRDVPFEINGDFAWLGRSNYKRRVIIPYDKELRGGNADLEVHDVVINSRGFRGNEFFTKKREETFRIVCLGDSWTFGERVNGPDTYPKKLEAFLNIEFPDRDIEALNLGIPGFTSLQGLKLFEKYVQTLEPDLIILGFNTNDARKAFMGFRNDTHLLNAGWKIMLGETIERYSKVYEVTMYYLRKWLRARASKGAIARINKPWWDYNPRNTAEEYYNNILRIVRIAKENSIEPILLHSAGYYPYNFVLAQLIHVAQQENVALVNTQPLIHQRMQEVQKGIEEKFRLAPPKGKSPSGDVDREEIVFRLHFPEEGRSSSLRPEGRPVLHVLVRTVDKIIELPLFDDGTHGDQRPDDHVWSTTYRFTPVEQHRVVDYVDEDGTRFKAAFLYYLFTFKSTDGRVHYELYGESAINDPSRTHDWRTILVHSTGNNRFIPFDYRSSETDKIYTPIHTFWHKDYTSDHIGHTTSEGYQRMARKLAEAVQSSRSFTAYLERSRGDTLN